MKGDAARLHASVSQGDLEGVEEQLEAGVNPDVLDGNGLTPLQKSMQHIENPRQAEIVGELVRAGAAMDLTNEEGLSLEGIAMERMRELAADGIFPDTPAQANEARSDPMSPCAAAEATLRAVRRRRAVAAILRMEPLSDARDCDGNGRLHYLAGLGELKEINRALRLGAYPAPQNRLGQTPAFLAVKHDKTAVLQLLLSRDPAWRGRTDWQGNSIAHFAAAHGSPECVALLDEELGSGTAVYESGNAAGDTPLHAALRAGREETALQLIGFLQVREAEHLCDVNPSYPQHTMTPLLVAARAGLAGACAALIRAGADLEARSGGVGPLGQALHSGDLDTVKVIRAANPASTEAIPGKAGQWHQPEKYVAARILEARNRGDEQEAWRYRRIFDELKKTAEGGPAAQPGEEPAP